MFEEKKRNLLPYQHCFDFQLYPTFEGLFF